jgi:Ca2+-binding RTX toxin-like protein
MQPSLIVDYSSNLYAGTTTWPSGLTGELSDPNGTGGWNGRFYAYTRNDGDHDIVNFSNIERFQIKGTNFNDTFDRGGYGVFNIDGGAGTDIIRSADFSNETAGLTVDNSGITLTQANGNVVKNVEVFSNLWTGTGNDTINYSVGLRNWENINTGAGNDTINTGSGQDTVDGGEGNDLLIVDYSSNLYAGTTTWPSGLTGELSILMALVDGMVAFMPTPETMVTMTLLTSAISNVSKSRGLILMTPLTEGGYGVFNIDGGAGTNIHPVC